jgi:hypothetical protein
MDDQIDNQRVDAKCRHGSPCPKYHLEGVDIPVAIYSMSTVVFDEGLGEVLMTQSWCTQIGLRTTGIAVRWFSIPIMKPPQISLQVLWTESAIRKKRSLYEVFS